MKQSSLHAQHETLGAHFQSFGEWEKPEHYGDSTAEHLAVRQNVGLADLSLRGKCKVTGDDRIKWLQSLVSNDILPLQTGQGLNSALMNHKGKMLSYFRVFILEDFVLIEDVGEIGDTTYQALRKFLLFGTQAKMENCGERWGTLLICGPQANQLVQTALSLDMSEAPPLAIKSASVDQHQVFVARTDETGEIDLEIFVPGDGLMLVWERLWSVGQPLGLRAIGSAALESLRIEAGIPKTGPDLNEGIVPPEANLEGKAFSLTKGCYPGQEVVARMDTYGSVKRRLVGLLIDGDEGCLPEHGAKLYSGEREVGWVSSAAFSPTLKKPLAFGFPLRDFTKSETELTVEIQGSQKKATVHPLPFYSRS